MITAHSNSLTMQYITSNCYRFSTMHSTYEWFTITNPSHWLALTVEHISAFVRLFHWLKLCDMFSAHEFNIEIRFWSIQTWPYSHLLNQVEIVRCEYPCDLFLFITIYIPHCSFLFFLKPALHLIHLFGLLLHFWQFFAIHTKKKTNYVVNANTLNILIIRFILKVSYIPGVTGVSA